jgi:G3E family GTPase
VDPDWIVIETSGVALPFETQLNLYRPEVRDWVGDESVVVVVDSEGFLAGPADPGTFENQVSGADLLVLHKVDLVSREQVEEARAGLLKINPDAPVLEASFGNIPLEALFPEGPRPDPHHDHDHHHEHAPHSRFHSFELFFTPGQSEEVIRETVLGQKAVRAKGFVESSTGVRVVQGVGRRVELSPVDQPVGKDLLGRVVVIKLEA